jgi:hypothetical protein
MSSPGRAPAASTSEATAPVVAAGVLQLTPGNVEVWGNPRVGEELMVVSSSWSPAGVHLAYQWLANGDEIPGATSERIKLTDAQGGKKISARVTGSKSGYADTPRVSAETEPVVVSTPFGAPSGLQARRSTITTVDLTWTKVDGAAKYRIYYGIGTGTRTKVEVGQVTSTTLKGLKPNTTYSIDIAALRSDGTRSPYSPRIDAETETLSQPDLLAVTESTPTTLTLVWAKAGGDVPKYRIYHGVGDGPRTKTEVGDVSTATLTGLTPGTTYSIDIASVLADGTRSAYSPRIDGTTTRFDPPANLKSTSITSSTIGLEWSKVPSAVKYRLYYGTPTGSRTKIEVGDVDELTINGLKAKTTYTIDISAFNANGEQSKYSPRVNVTTR